jgi:TPR repeat protein
MKTMNFKEQYDRLLSKKKQNPAALSEESVNLINDLKSPDKWFEAMAVCEAAFDAGTQDENILNLRREMFFHGKELHSGINLNGEDYADWFVQLVDFNKKLADAGVEESWVELGSLYDNARFPFRDTSKAREYMLKGVDMDVPLALALYGHQLYYGINLANPDKEKGLELMLRAKEKNFERADIYLLLSEYDRYTDPAVYEQKVKDYNSTAKSVNQIWYLLGDLYCDKLNDVKKAVEAYDKGIELTGEPYCMYKKALIILNSEIEGDKDEALLMLESAYEWNEVYAADFLGQFYYFNEEYQNVEKSVEWYKKAISYYNSHSMLNLSFIYLYNNEYKNIEKGLEYMDMAIDNGNVRAMSEKAYFLLETEEENRNIPLAKELLEKAYDAGDGYAAYRLGYGYQNAEFSEERDYETAFKYYIVGAERNHLFAIELLGRYYKIGIAGEPNPEKAIECYNEAVGRGSNYARVELALCYEEGFGVEQDENKAFELLKLAADENYSYAQVKLGYYYMNGVAVERDFDKSFEYFSKAAENENFDAMYNLGRMYKYSIGRPENPELALKYLEKAAEGGDVDANIEMGISYEHEYGGLEFDGEKTMQYMANAAEQQHPYAQYKLGVYHYYGLVEKDMEKGLEYLRKAYENGSPHAAAVLGDHFIYGADENGDSNNAFQYYKYAAENDYITEGIGLCYQYGIGVERSESEAFKYFSIAADRDYTAAKYRLGICYKYEIGTVKNLTEAYRWLSEAAEEGSRNAEYEVGMMLLDGEGVSMDLEKGVEWLCKAAEKEHDDAQFELGNCYLMGRGVAEDEIQSMYWYQKAAENGNEKAQKIIGKRSKHRR